MTSKDVVKPIALAEEWNVRPQYVYALIREGKLPSHQCTCGHVYLVRDEVNAFIEARKAKKEA